MLVVDEYKAVRNFPLIIAERLGYLRNERFDVTAMNVRDDIFHADLLADGRVDAVMAYYHHNIVNHSEGRPSQAVVTLGLTPGMKVMVGNQLKDRISTLADLKGRRILVGGDGSSKTTLANYLMRAAGLDRSDYTRLPTYGQEKNAQMLRDGKADLVIAPVPEGDYYEATGVASVLFDLTTPDETRRILGHPFPTTTVFMASETIRRRPDMASHLAGAFVRTLQYINSHTPEQLGQLIPVEVSGKDRSTYLKALKQEYPMFRSDGRMPGDGARQEWEVLRWARPDFTKVHVDDTFDNRFVDAVLRQSR